MAAMYVLPPCAMLVMRSLTPAGLGLGLGPRPGGGDLRTLFPHGLIELLHAQAQNGTGVPAARERLLGEPIGFFLLNAPCAARENGCCNYPCDK